MRNKPTRTEQTGQAPTDLKRKRILEDGKHTGEWHRNHSRAKYTKAFHAVSHKCPAARAVASTWTGVEFV